MSDAMLGSSHRTCAGKIASRAQAVAAMARLPQPRVFTNGVFDLLHAGHCLMLERARAAGAALVVGLNSDASARRLGKGPGRPINPAVDRAVVLAALAAVDLVVVFEEDTPCELLKLLRPEIYVKGADYDMAGLREATLVAGWGGRGVTLPLHDGRSTTAIVQGVLRAHGVADAQPAHGEAS